MVEWLNDCGCDSIRVVCEIEGYEYEFVGQPYNDTIVNEYNTCEYGGEYEYDDLEY